MSGSVAAGPAASEPGVTSVPHLAAARRSAWLAASTVGVAAALFAGGFWFWQAVRADGGGMSQWADFAGWQVSAMEAGLAAVLAVVFVASAVGIQRSYRSLTHRRLQRRLTLIVTVVPALALGAGTSLALPKAVGWASERTAAASRFAAEQRALRVELRDHPLIPTVEATPAPPQVARRLLGPGDLGPGWFDFVRPAPSKGAAEPLPARWTVLDDARALLVQSHRVGDVNWVNDQTVLESYWRLPDARTAGEVRAYLGRRSAARGFLDHSVVAGVGNEVILIRQITGDASTPQPSLRQIERLAVQRLR